MQYVFCVKTNKIIAVSPENCSITGLIDSGKYASVPEAISTVLRAQYSKYDSVLWHIAAIVNNELQIDTEKGELLLSRVAQRPEEPITPSIASQLSALNSSLNSSIRNINNQINANRVRAEKCRLGTTRQVMWTQAGGYVINSQGYYTDSAGVVRHCGNQNIVLNSYGVMSIWDSTGTCHWPKRHIASIVVRGTMYTNPGWGVQKWGVQIL